MAKNWTLPGCVLHDKFHAAGKPKKAEQKQCENLRRESRVKKTAARFFHSKFETKPPWLMCDFEAFMAQ